MKVAPPQLPLASNKTIESTITDLRDKLNMKAAPQQLPFVSSKTNESTIIDLREKINRKASSNLLPLTAPMPTPKLPTPPPQPETKSASVLRTNAPPFTPTNSNTVLPQQPQKPTPHVSSREPIPIVEPPVSRLQQRLRINVKPESTRSAVPEPTTPPVATVTDNVPSAPTTLAKPIVRSKLSDRLIQRPTLPRKITPPAAPVIVQPAGYPYTQPPPSNGKSHQQDPITALATYSKSLGFGIPEYKILRVPKTNRIQCRVMVRIHK